MERMVYYFEVESCCDGINVDCGFIEGESYSEAASKVEKYFGNELMTIKLEALDTTIMLMNKETAKQVINYNF